MSAKSLTEILKIETEEDLYKTIDEFEITLNNMLKPLQDKLQQQVGTAEIPQLELHMTYVESWRDRVSRLLMYSMALAQHGRSRRFMVSTEKSLTKTAHEKELTNAASCLVTYLEHLIKTIDSRVNLCKKFLESAYNGAMNKRYA